MAPRKRMIACLGVNTMNQQASMDLIGQLLITATDIDQFVVTSTAVHRDHALSLLQKRQTARLIKAMTGEVQRVVIVRDTPPLQQIQMMIVPGDRLRDF